MLRGQAVQLSPAQRQRIMAARQATNPLYLTILLEYLACTSVAADAAAPADPESVDRLITHYLKAPDALSLYIKVIERLEGTYGQNVMRDILTSLYVARSGLSEAELQDVRGAALALLSLWGRGGGGHGRSRWGRTLASRGGEAAHSSCAWTTRRGSPSTP